MQNIKDLITLAIQCQFTRAGEVLVSNLEFLPEVRDMCAVNRCNSYGKNWVCPPACGTLDEIVERVSKYERGVLVQTVGELEDSFDYDSMTDAAQRHNKYFCSMLDIIQEMKLDCLPMAAGGCSICSKCTYPHQSCRHPNHAFPSMEAYGLFVSKVCELTNMPYNDGPNTVTYTSCILIN